MQEAVAHEADLQAQTWGTSCWPGAHQAPCSSHLSSVERHACRALPTLQGALHGVRVIERCARLPLPRAQL
jgi:hypothetical protein